MRPTCDDNAPIASSGSPGYNGAKDAHTTVASIGGPSQGDPKQDERHYQPGVLERMQGSDHQEAPSAYVQDAEHHPR